MANPHPFLFARLPRGAAQRSVRVVADLVEQTSTSGLRKGGGGMGIGTRRRARVRLGALSANTRHQRPKHTIAGAHTGTPRSLSLCVSLHFAFFIIIIIIFIPFLAVASLLPLRRGERQRRRVFLFSATLAKVSDIPVLATVCCASWPSPTTQKHLTLC